MRNRLLVATVLSLAFAGCADDLASRSPIPTPGALEVGSSDDLTGMDADQDLGNQEIDQGLAGDLSLQEDAATEAGPNPGVDADGDSPQADGTEGLATSADVTGVDDVQDADSQEDTAADVNAIAANPHLCNPCSSSQACAGGLCVAHGWDGSFCAQDCSAAGCPDGYHCQQIVSVEGQSASQCLPIPAVGQLWGDCTCNAAATVLGLSTSCAQVWKAADGAAAGACVGLRWCASGGLTLCDAPTPTAEVCDSLDNNCNGLTDEGSPCDDGNACTSDLCQGGQCLISLNEAFCDLDGDICTADKCSGGECLPGALKACADDGNPCTADECQPSQGCSHPFVDALPCVPKGIFCVAGACQAGQCVAASSAGCDDNNACTLDLCDPVMGVCSNTALGNAPCSDGSACSQNDSCVFGKCLGSNVNCDDGNPCTIDACLPASGCVSPWAADGLPCSDGDACTLGDACKAGKCTGPLSVTCEKPSNCQVAVCQSSSGACATVPAIQGQACDDSNACTQGESCQAGSCTGILVGCDDGNPCTDDSCAPSTGCQHSFNTSSCSDGSACTQVDTCLLGQCLAGAPKSCDDANPCSFDVCDVGSGACIHIAQSAVCDDGQACTVGDICISGVCAGAPASCVDSNPCTVDLCDPKQGCLHLAVAATDVACDDENACTISDLCLGAVCKAGGPAACADGNPCTDDSCDPNVGCQHVANSVVCDDGYACTVGDYCQAGQCVSGVSGCQCQTLSDCAKLEDGNLCNGTLQCVANACVLNAATIVVCDSSKDNSCLHATCSPQTGQCAPVASPDASPCSDNDACTLGDACSGGQCIGPKLLGCDDKNPCTIDSCDATFGCSSAYATSNCDDGSPCTQGDACNAGLCVGQAISCDDGNACTTDSCVNPKGCQHIFVGGPCDDGSACTVQDVCVAGLCTAGVTVVCNDGNPCTIDSCSALSGCQSAPLVAPCNDGNPCTLGDQCLAGKCQGGLNTKNCSDGDPCTADSCVAMTGSCIHVAINGCGGNCTADSDCPATAGGCQVGHCTKNKCSFAPVTNGIACNDANLCTTGESCKGGVCKGGLAKVCDDGNVCTLDSCSFASGQCTFASAIGTPCSDGNACTSNDFCWLGGCQSGQAKACADSDPCTADTCLPSSGDCSHKAIPGCISQCTTAADCGISPDPCQFLTCNVAKGQCQTKPAANLTACNDGNPCTSQDLCFGGLCQGIGTLNCSDGNPCTTDSCNKALGQCVHAPATGECTDGNPCTIGDQCAGGGCQPGAAKVCNDGKPCTADVCDAKTGICVFKAIPGCP